MSRSPGLQTRRKFIGSAAILAGVAALPSHGLAASKMLRAGVAKRVVTPPLWIPYLTSSSQGTNGAFKGVHCDLFARALVLDDGRNPLAVIAVDSIGYDNLVMGRDRHFTRELRERIAEGTKLKRDAIMLTATHAHSTPETIGLSGLADRADAKEWLEKHLLELADTAIEAWQNREPVQAFYRTTEVTGIGRNRRILLKTGKMNRHGPVPSNGEIAKPAPTDEQLAMLAFRRFDGSAHSLLLNYTAHPVVSMLLPEVCADFPGAAAEMIEREWKGAVCLFTNGAAGNINSIHVSTNYKDVDVLGRKLAATALQECRASEGDRPIAANLAYRSTEFKLKARPCPSLYKAEELFEKEPTAKNEVILRLARKLDEDPLRAEVQAMRIGPVKWVSLPGEGFVETGLALKKAGASFVTGYANGWLGYFPTRAAYEEGGYEVEQGAWSRVAPGSAEQLEVAAVKLLAKL